jgi:hypothetical protein
MPRSECDVSEDSTPALPKDGEELVSLDARMHKELQRGGVPNNGDSVKGTLTKTELQMEKSAEVGEEGSGNESQNMDFEVGSDKNRIQRIQSTIVVVENDAAMTRMH